MWRYIIPKLLIESQLAKLFSAREKCLLDQVRGTLFTLPPPAFVNTTFNFNAALLIHLRLLLYFLYPL